MNHHLIDGIENRGNQERGAKIFPPTSQECTALVRICERLPQICRTTFSGVFQAGPESHDDANCRLEIEPEVKRTGRTGNEVVPSPCDGIRNRISELIRHYGFAIASALC